MSTNIFQVSLKLGESATLADVAHALQRAQDSLMSAHPSGVVPADGLRNDVRTERVEGEWRFQSDPIAATIWTLTANHDGEVFVSVYTDEAKMRGAVWADVVESADRDSHDLDEGLGEDEFGDELDKAELDDWCRFIETHGWKCREYTVTPHTVTLPTGAPA